MRLERDLKFGFCICPECGLPLIEIPHYYWCNGKWKGISGCGFMIKKDEVYYYS